VRNVHLVLIGFTLIGAACRQQAQAPAATPAPAPLPSPPAAAAPFAPGLGEIMTLQQMRHTKLWLAAEAGNWPLASYEIKELGEGFDDVLAFHPTDDESPVAPKDAIPRIMTEPLSELRAAVEKKDKKQFEQTYDGVTKACNDCHHATNFGFNHVQRPTGNPYPDQVFAPVPDAVTP
jgi:hypothetical protein